MMRTYDILKFHSPLILWLFVILELILVVYQLFYFYTAKDRYKNWFPLPILFLLLLWNCTLGQTVLIYRTAEINIAVLLVAVILMLVPFFRKHNCAEVLESPNDASDSGEQTDRFIENFRLYQLSAREIDVVLLIRKGYKNKMIADELFISEKTVESHLQNIYDKVGERSKFALISKLNQ